MYVRREDLNWAVLTQSQRKLWGRYDGVKESNDEEMFTRGDHRGISQDEECVLFFKGSTVVSMLAHTTVGNGKALEEDRQGQAV